MLENWSDVIKIFGILSVLLLSATFIKAKIKFFQNYFIPNSIIAGFLGLVLGPQVLHLFNMSPDIIKNYLYHLLGITFIALSLQKTEKIRGRESMVPVTSRSA
jgi:ESS family glutamate:Na+ symporter